MAKNYDYKYNGYNYGNNVVGNAVSPKEEQYSTISNWDKLEKACKMMKKS